ncbi:Transposase [Thermobacillus composti KWC4]|uniref:Transposase n=1 Tax=Thermobacillus composti (strain DSM 18247 / JCM 13945 / KWC4) TaxID=717605 RepID=L0EGC5_THECK|nr:transposase [Thermobacillus composti]AGA58694.1 Transposase [Thermobacillus composti KWC4]
MRKQNCGSARMMARSRFEIFLQVARELGVSDNTLYRWISEFKQDPVNAFRGSGNLKMEEKTFLDMQKRIRQLEMENEILKKAMHIFAKDRN